MRPRALTAVIASVALLTGVLLGQQDAGGSRVSAQEPPAIYYGFVSGALGGGDTSPTRVRAYIGETVCGTASIAATPEVEIGFYTIEVASAAEKPGCGSAGLAVQLRLFSGELDAGLPATQALWSGGLHRLDLSTLGSSQAGSFVGGLPDGPGAAQLRWAGASGVPIADAIATIPREVEAVFHWNVGEQAWHYYFAGAPASTATYQLVDADDIVFVRMK